MHYNTMSCILPTKSWRSVVLFFGLLIVSLFFISCTKTTKVTRYQIIFGCDEVTQPRIVEMLAGKDASEPLLQIVNDIDKLKSSIDQSWQAEIVNDRFDAEDKNAENRYDENLQRVKEFEAQCKKKLEELDPHPGSNFYLSIVYKLNRSVPADGSDVCMKEYRFELRY